jgi:type II secretory pathway pseudopilin PulG
MTSHKRAFTLIELLMVGVVLIVLALLLLPAMKQRWNADGLTTSLNNVRQILVACGEYRLDKANRVPMRGTGYSNGQITGGWDTWNFAGKNCDVFWASSSGGVFDENAYGRFLNPYLAPALPPVPAGYLNVGSGATWTFNDGTITPQQRAFYGVKVCRSPGDVRTYQPNWPTPTISRSGYNDVGTSYLLNMKWWSQPGGPANFTARYNAGTQAINNGNHGVFGKKQASDFVWIHDQIADIVANTATGNIVGEFGGNNMSVFGYQDGRAAYTEVLHNVLSGPGYTFGITW